MAGHWLRGLLIRAKGLVKPLRLGVRGLVIDRREAGGDHILLVRHTYVAGWYLPGGGVDPGESAVAALSRELLEEAGVELRGTPQLHGVFFNPTTSKNDHVVCYVIEAFHCRPAHPPDFEIAEARFFSVDALPAEATRATRARIEEVLCGKPVSDLW